MTGRGRPCTVKTPSRTVAGSTTVQNVPKMTRATKDCKKKAEEKPQRTEKEKPKKREEKQPSAEKEIPKKREEKPQSAEKEIPKKREEKQSSNEKEIPKKREEKSARDRLVREEPPRAEEEKPKCREQREQHSSAKKPGILREKSEEEKPRKPKLVADGVRSKSLGYSNTEEIPDRKEPRFTKAKCPMPETKKEDEDQILIMTLAKLKIKKMERAEAASIINRTVKSIKDHLKMTKCFKDVRDLPTGSYYENLKIVNPDEFDVMMTIPVPRIDVQPMDEEGAFYTASFKRGSHPLKEVFQQEDNIIPASEILKEFRNEVTKSVKSLQNITLDRKKKGCPAVTLSITLNGQDPISLDIVLGLEVTASWPPFTNKGLQIERWLGTKVKQDFKREPYYLVPKYEGAGTKKRVGGLAKDGWRISFSHVEKMIMKNHGSEKTCCEAQGTSCCRKGCLKLLKHLLGLLKEKDATLSNFCSYHAKTTLLHACSSRTKDSEWDSARLGHCFRQLLGDFESHLRKGKLPNFFIPTQNLLSGHSERSCKNLLKYIQEEQTNGFPIFC